MKLFAPYQNPFEPNSGPDLSRFVDRREFNDLARKVGELERLVRSLEGASSMRPMIDSSRYYHRPAGGEYGDIAGLIAQSPPWVSNSVRVLTNLVEATSPRRTIGDSLLLGLAFGIMGGLAALWLDLPLVPTVAWSSLSGTALSAGALILLNRAELHWSQSRQGSRGKRKQEMRVTVGHEGADNQKFLYLNSNITPAQIREFAGAVLDGSSLAVHKWTGQGALFTRGQYDDLMTELEKMNYVCAGAGNVSRRLTPQGRALMRGLVGRRPPATKTD